MVAYHDTSFGVYRHRWLYEYRTRRRFISGRVTAAISGDATASITEADVVAGGKQIIIDLTGDVWVDSGAAFNGQRQNIIDGLDSDGVEGTGWNAEVRDKEVVGAVVRTSDTRVTITMSAAGAYNISSSETVTVTVPATALAENAHDVVGSPTFSVSAVGAGVAPTGHLYGPLVGPMGGAV